MIGIRGGDDGYVVRDGAGRQQQVRWSERSVWIAPIGIDDAEVSVTASIPEALHLYVQPRQFNLLADQFDLPRTRVHALRYTGGRHDPLIYQIGLSILSELTEESATGRMFAETASLMLAARLIHSYADSSVFKPCINGSYRLDNSRLRRVLDHIEEHIEEEITVAGLADLANLSVFHFTRMFTAAVGDPPHRYVSQRRLEKAMAMLAIGKLSLSEIAYRSRFSSQASFSRAFRRAAGMTPGEYRRQVR